jgi:hypothetical protein
MGVGVDAEPALMHACSGPGAELAGRIESRRYGGRERHLGAGTAHESRPRRGRHSPRE